MMKMMVRMEVQTTKQPPLLVDYTMNPPVIDNDGDDDKDDEEDGGDGNEDDDEDGVGGDEDDGEDGGANNQAALLLDYTMNPPLL